MDGLNSKTVAGLIGRSIYTLQRARHDRDDLHMPPHVRHGRSVRYPLAALLDWARWRDVRLHWEHLPWRYVLPAMHAHETAGVPLPVGLRLRLRLPLPLDLAPKWLLRTRQTLPRVRLSA